MPVDRDFTLRTLQDLIRIDSRNPGLEVGAPGEAALARHVASLLGELGWNAAFQDVGQGRGNVLATWRGAGRGPSLMINTHLDTVGTAGMADPFGATLREGRVHGRGAQDTKGGMAAVLALAKRLADEGVELPGDLVLAFVADEENESLGTAELVKSVRTDAALVIEPSDLDVCVAHRGFGIFRLGTRGRTAHGGRADLGVDANTHMGHLVVEIDRLGRSWKTRHRHELLGPATLHVPLISGGRQLFIYSAECTADLECRTVPGQSREGVLGEIREALGSLGKRIEGFRGEVEPVMWRDPHEIDPDRPIVRAVLAAAREVRGEPARTIGHGWWEDSALLGAAGIDAVVLGPRGGGMHTGEEWVEIDSVLDLAEILWRTARAYGLTG